VHNHAQPQLDASPSTQTNIKHSLTRTLPVTYPHPHLHQHPRKRNLTRILHAWTHAKQKHARTFNLLINKCHTLLLAFSVNCKIKTEAASQTVDNECHWWWENVVCCVVVIVGVLHLAACDKGSVTIPHFIPTFKLITHFPTYKICGRQHTSDIFSTGTETIHHDWTHLLGAMVDSCSLKTPRSECIPVRLNHTSVLPNRSCLFVCLFVSCGHSTSAWSWISRLAGHATRRLGIVVHGLNRVKVGEKLFEVDTRRSC
jgi:hypothetical protein